MAQEGQPLHPGRLGKADLAESWAEPSHEPSLRFLGCLLYTSDAADE